MQLLGRSTKDIVAITMPCFGTSKRTFDNSVALPKCFNATIKKIDITKTVKRHLKDINHSEDLHDAAYENAQARERTQVLMDYANSVNGLVVGTGDLSELALGWATYNGDHMSMYAVNGSIPKTLVRHLVDYTANKGKGKLKAVLKDVLDTPVSPELIPSNDNKIGQVTEDIVGPYILHDFFLYNIVKRGFTPSKTYQVALNTFKDEFDSETILKWLKTFIRRFFSQQFKRSCLPDGIKVSEISLSPRGSYKMPSDAISKLWLDELDKI
jgi:NAD+ synthase (glutamine-hydrolysing)